MTQLRHFVFGKRRNSPEAEFELIAGHAAGGEGNKCLALARAVHGQVEKVLAKWQPEALPEVFFALDGEWIYARLFAVGMRGSANFHAFVLSEDELEQLGWQPWSLNTIAARQLSPGMLRLEGRDVQLGERLPVTLALPLPLQGKVEGTEGARVLITPSEHRYIVTSPREGEAKLRALLVKVLQQERGAAYAWVGGAASNSDGLSVLAASFSLVLVPGSSYLGSVEGFSQCGEAVPPGIMIYRSVAVLAAQPERSASGRSTHVDTHKTSAKKNLPPIVPKEPPVEPLARVPGSDSWGERAESESRDSLWTQAPGKGPVGFVAADTPSIGAMETTGRGSRRRALTPWVVSLTVLTVANIALLGAALVVRRNGDYITEPFRVMQDRITALEDGARSARASVNGSTEGVEPKAIGRDVSAQDPIADRLSIVEASLAMREENDGVWLFEREGKLYVAAKSDDRLKVRSVELERLEGPMAWRDSAFPAWEAVARDGFWVRQDGNRLFMGNVLSGDASSSIDMGHTGKIAAVSPDIEDGHGEKHLVVSITSDHAKWDGANTEFAICAIEPHGSSVELGIVSVEIEASSISAVAIDGWWSSAERRSAFLVAAKDGDFCEARWTGSSWDLNYKNGNNKNWYGRPDLLQSVSGREPVWILGMVGTMHADIYRWSSTRCPGGWADAEFLVADGRVAAVVEWEGQMLAARPNGRVFRIKE